MDCYNKASGHAKKFFSWYGEVFAKGALSEREKSLITLVTGQHCFGCAAGSGSSCGGSLAESKS